VRWQGNEVTLSHPRVIERATALVAAGPAFQGYERLLMRAIGVMHSLRLDTIDERVVSLNAAPSSSPRSAGSSSPFVRRGSPHRW
jgi:hypothetical protein